MCFYEAKVWEKPKIRELKRRCSTCGKGITPRVDAGTGEILSKHYYFGTVDLSVVKRSKYLYSLRGEKRPNPLYDPSVKRKLPLEIWECDRCFSRGDEKTKRTWKR